jgi:glucokinase
MSLLGVDLGGTKLALAIFDRSGLISLKESFTIGKRNGPEVGKLITDKIIMYLQKLQSGVDTINSIGVSVPGISHAATGTVWAPNIKGWTNYPLLSEIRSVCDIPVTIDSDRACYILGETWKGNARGCKDAIYLSVGTGIGAGILVNGEVLRGSHDIAGCAGWMTIERPFKKEYATCGCFEYFASGEGISNTARTFLKKQKNHKSELMNIQPDRITSSDVFRAYDKGDELAVQVIQLCIEFWGMAVANLVNLFNPEKIIFGGGVFGPAVKLIPAISAEASKWAQPIGFSQVTIDSSSLAGDAGMYGAAFLALKNSPD